MSREGLANFLRAVDHHQGLRREALACSNDDDLISLARANGFALNAADLHADAMDSAMGQWFTTSRISKPFL